MEESHVNISALSFEKNRANLRARLDRPARRGEQIFIAMESKVLNYCIKFHPYQQLQLQIQSTTYAESLTLKLTHTCITKIELSYCGQDCQKIPPTLWKMYGAKVLQLDLSYNSIETLKGLECFTKLQELMLDNNKLGDSVTFPQLPYLRTLSINNNKITDLEEFINKICDNCPSLSYLSLLCNKACPNQLSDLNKDDSDYQRYRYFVIHKLRNLQFLDSRRVSAKERSEAFVRGQFMRVRRPPDDAVDSPNQPLSTVQQKPLPVDLASLGKHRGAYGKCHYKYTGKQSEGNRFIVNNDL